MEKHIRSSDQREQDRLRGQYELACWLVTGTVPQQAKAELKIDVATQLNQQEYMPCLPSEK